jgi:uncharacterized membrane protein
VTDEREAIERLERRVAQLESLVRRLAASSAVDRAPLSARRAVPPPQPARVTAPPAPPEPPVVRPKAASSPSVDLEQWVGERGLLAVGVLALLATGGFFLNYAFDRGWIPEWLRTTAAVLAGAGVATWGDRLVRRGLRGYGAALIGAGGGLVYLGFWAAAGPYDIVPKDIGVLLLAGTSAGVAVFAARHDVEALAVWALSGAYLAPVFLPDPGAPVEKFFAYMAVAGSGSLFLGYRLAWRTTFDVALFGFFLLPVLLVASELDSVAAVNYVAFGGVLALLATGRTAWPEARLGALVLPWLYLLPIALNVESQAIRWTALASGLILAAAVWWQHLGRDPLARSTLGVLRSVPEAIVYVAGPIAAVYLAAHARPQALAAWGGAVALALAGLYLGAGWPRRSAHLIGMGTALLALAIAGQWDGTAVAIGWGALALAAVATDRRFDRRAARDVGLGVAVCAFLQLFVIALAQRPPAEAAFTGLWALGWYAMLGATVAAAAAWWGRGAGDALRAGRDALWLLAGAALLLGGSIELERLLPATLPAETGPLAGHVTTATFWVLAAAAIVRLSQWLTSESLRPIALMSAVALAALAFYLIFGPAREVRAASDPAFVGLWSIGWYAQCALPMLAAHWWRVPATASPSLRPGAVALWTVGGAALLLGGSIELHRFFVAKLAADLAISAFWIIYAGALVQLGFWRERKAVRSAGLAVAGLAIVKIAFYDLANLEALYRVASFFILAVIALAVAYLYNRTAKHVS